MGRRHGRGIYRGNRRGSKRQIKEDKYLEKQSLDPSDKIGDSKRRRLEEESQEKSSSEESGSDEECSAYEQLLSSVTASQSAEEELTSGDDAVSDSESNNEHEMNEQDSDEEDEHGGHSTQNKQSTTKRLADKQNHQTPEEDADYRHAIYNSEDEAAGDDDEELSDAFKGPDPFSEHFEKDIDDDLAESLGQSRDWKRQEIKVPDVGKATLIWPEKGKKIIPIERETNIRRLHVKERLCNHAAEVNKDVLKLDLPPDSNLTYLQHRLFTIMNNYQDLYYTERNWKNGEEIRLVYCLHAVNHILKTRNKVISHNMKQKEKQGLLNEEYRDQGLTRPKVLIVLPFRDSALKVVNLMTDLLMPKEQCYVMNKKRFKTEYGEDEEPHKGHKPEDFEATFTGNIDDHFRIGIGLAKKTLKLYTEFYSADIILASPLGLRTIIGAEGEAERDFDFLSSIELLIFDQTDVFLMQNWDHVLHLMQHLHIQPKESHGVDFSRVRMWTLSGQSKYYRQTLIFTDVPSPESNALFNKYCHNYAGKILIPKTPGSGTICQIITALPQMFHRIEAESYALLADTRFEFFIKKILPQHRTPVKSQTLIFIPSYFDFVRIRNYLKKEDINFVHICEYSKDRHINRARGLFHARKTPIMLFTERLHFYKRYKLKGMQHVIFYELPLYPHFYSEVCNLLQDQRRKKDLDNLSCTVIYSKYDAQKLTAVVGSNRAAHMLTGDKSVYMFVTGDT